MSKILLAILIFGAAGFALFFFGRSDELPEDFQPEEDVSYEEIEQALKEDGKRTVIGSCNIIAAKSSCVDYIGSMWGDANMAELNCGEEGSFSNNACPYAEFGGCQTSGGTVMEMVIWAYREGPGGYDEESVPYARAACDANPQAQWILPDDQLGM
jgi:hypothetical protein